MASRAGDDYYLNAGESLFISVTAYQEDGVTLEDDLESAVLVCRQDYVTFEKEAVIVGAGIFCELKEDDSIVMYGAYKYEVRSKTNAGVVKTQQEGRITVWAGAKASVM